MLPMTARARSNIYSLATPRSGCLPGYMPDHSAALHAVSFTKESFHEALPWFLLSINHAHIRSEAY